MNTAIASSYPAAVRPNSHAGHNHGPGVVHAEHETKRVRSPSKAAVDVESGGHFDASDPSPVSRPSNSNNEIYHLTEDEQRMLRELRARDREVRAHEQAHAVAGGKYAGSPNYTFQRGPDGRNYAVGGEVSIDISPGKTPEETISKMKTVRRAALAPAEPSSQDRRVAAQASQEITKAEAEKIQIKNAEKQQEAKEQVEEARGKESSTNEVGSSSAETASAPSIQQTTSLSSNASPAIQSGGHGGGKFCQNCLSKAFEGAVSPKNNSTMSIVLN